MKLYQKIELCLVLVALIAVAAIWLAVGTSLRLEASQRQYEVMQACGRAHVTDSGALEQRCDDLTTKYNIDFVCDSYDAYAYCQAEVK